MRSRAFIFFILAITFSLVARADDWYPGSMVLKSGKVLRGQISVNYEHDVVLFRLGNADMVYPAHKVRSFTIMDAAGEARRSFISLQLSIGPATMYRFYEIILNGNISVLRRQRVVWYSVHMDEETFDYFVHNGNEVTSLQIFKRKVLPVMLRAQETELASYVRQHHLSKHKLPHLIRIINYYNVEVSKSPLARN